MRIDIFFTRTTKPICNSANYCPKYDNFDQTQVIHLNYFVSIIYMMIHVKELGDNCIVFENFTASIGDLMIAN